MLPIFANGYQIEYLSAEYINYVWTLADGLPQNTVFDIIQDKQGYIWVGTAEGAAKFNGTDFSVLNRYNTAAIEHNSIKCICPMKDGSIWLGTFGGGITIIHHNVLSVKNVKNGFPSDFIWSIFQDSKNRIWVATIGAGVLIIESGSVRQFGFGQKQVPVNVHAFSEDQKQNIWIGSENGLYVVKSDCSERYTVADGLLDDCIMSLLIDQTDNVWAGTPKGLNLIPRGGIAGCKPIPETKDCLVRSMVIDDRNQMWLATEEGLLRLSNQMVYRFDTHCQLSDCSLLKVMKDREGNIWTGSSGNGLNLISRRKIDVKTVKDGLNSNLLQSVYRDPGNNLWVTGRNGGVNCLKDCVWYEKPHYSFFSRTAITALWMDQHQKQFWLGTADGLFRVDMSAAKRFELLPLLKKAISAIFQDSSGRFWLGTVANGCYFLKNDKFIQFTGNNDIPKNNWQIYSIAEDADHLLWFASGSGVFNIPVLWEENSAEAVLPNVRFYSREDGLLDNTVYDIFCAADDVIWLATPVGISILSQGNFKNIGTAEGLPFSAVYKIMPDNHENIWMASNQGIMMIRQKDVLKLSESSTNVGSYFHFGAEDGLLSVVCSGPGQFSGAKTDDGVLWFPTHQGLARIDPQAIPHNEIAPTVNIESVWVNGQQIDHRQFGSFYAKTGSLEFTFSALSYSNLGKPKINCILHGYSQQWLDVANTRQIKFENVPAGNYHFRVVAANGDGQWNYQGDDYRFKLRLRFTETFLFRFALPAVFITFLLMIWYLIGKQIRMRISSRKYEFSSLTDAQIHSIVFRLQQLMKKETLYLDADVSIEKVARRLGVTTKHLSQSLNQDLHINFKTFINQYRIEAAKKKIIDPSEKDFVLLKIAFDVGFNSKSVFNSAFKKITGLTPSEYRKQFGKQ
jgi:ligand-binding sensor domain-containing protein/AraC-like DNA-binding protein